MAKRKEAITDDVFKMVTESIGSMMDKAPEEIEGDPWGDLQRYIEQLQQPTSMAKTNGIVIGFVFSVGMLMQMAEHDAASKLLQCLHMWTSETIHRTALENMKASYAGERA